MNGPQFNDRVEVIDGFLKGQRGKVTQTYGATDKDQWYDVDVTFPNYRRAIRHHSFSLRVLNILDLLAEV